MFVIIASSSRSLQEWSRRCGQDDERGIDAGGRLYWWSQDNDV